MGPVRHGQGGAPVRVLSPLALPDGTQVGRWRLEGPLGRGGFGAVYRAREAACTTGPLYALKLAQAPEDPGFGREAEALRRVRHPGVVRLVEAGTWETGTAGYPYLVLEYAPGEGLYRWARMRNPSARQVAGLLLQVAEALDVAHKAGVLHRDFKGGNAVVRPDGRVVVLDWGAGIYPEAAPLTRTGHLPQGTPQYYSPQVVRWRSRAARGGAGRYPYTVADEQYAVGTTFYRVLADEYPPRLLSGEEGSPEALELEALVPQQLRQLNPRVPQALADLVMRMLAPQPEARFASMAALVQAVREALAQAEAAWDAPLFEWYAGPGSHSRTTVDEDGWGPLAPGQEMALLLDRQRRADTQAYLAAERWIRRRHPQAVPALEAQVAPMPFGPEASPLPPSSGVAARTGMPGLKQVPRHHGARTWRLLVGAALLGSVAIGSVGGALVWVRSRDSEPALAREAVGGKVAPPVRRHHAAAPKEDAFPPQSPASLEESMKKESQPVRRPGLVTTLKRGVVAGCAAAACSGAQVRPSPDMPCPDGALQAMEELNLTRRQIDIYVDKDRLNNEVVFVSDGPITSRVFDSRLLPDGTLVHGWLWTKGDSVIGRYTQLELPNRRRYPVCLVLCYADGCPKRKESTPEQAAISNAKFFTAVESFK